MSRRARTHVVVLLGYTALSFAWFGARLLRAPGRLVFGTGPDPSIFVWSFAWWPHALASFANPFETDVMYYPSGVNLTWATSVPTLALAFAPLTAVAGPVVSYNAAAVLMPALTAFTAFLLCRYLTGSLWASLVGGYLFGFSAYAVVHLREGHVNLTGLFLLPLIALVVLRFLRSELDGRGLALRLGPLLALQLGISTEIALTLTLALAASLVLALALAPDVRGRVRASVGPIVAGYALGGVLAAPFVAYVLLGGIPDSFAGARSYHVDLANVVVPTPAIGLGGDALRSVSDRFPIGEPEAGAYLTLPALAIVAAYLVRARRRPATRFLAAALALALLASLGAFLQVGGRRLFTLPWALVDGLPLLENVGPSRLALYSALAVAVIVALWTARTPGRVLPRPFVLPVLAVLSLVPAVWEPELFRTDPPRPAFFAHGLHETCLAPDEPVMIFPFGIRGDSMLWQAEAGFRFRLSGGRTGPVRLGAPPLTDFDAEPTVRALNFSFDFARPSAERLLGYAAAYGVDRIVVAEGAEYPTAEQLARIGPVERIGGVLVAPACGEPTLRERRLDAEAEGYRRLLESGAEIGWCLGRDYYAIPLGLEPAGLLAGAAPARFVAGQGLTCEAPPAGYRDRGFAPPDLGVPESTYRLWAP